MTIQGKITKAIAGFYYVNVVGSGIYECKARGIFRKEMRKPLVGDDALIEVISGAEKTGNVVDLLPRKNELVRPPVANIDQVLLIFSMRTPDPNLILLDRFLIAAKRRGIPCLIGFNKVDIVGDSSGDGRGGSGSDLCSRGVPGECMEILAAYHDSGVPLYFFSVRTGEGMDEMRRVLRGKMTALAGPSGVGKSSFTNAVQDNVHMEVGDISKKLSRGKNTTRHLELICVEDGTFLCDTPGFSALDTQSMPKEELEEYYAEFHPYIGKCFYQGCAHLSEPDCAVKQALHEGKISAERYEHYRYLYEELKEEEKRTFKRR